MAVTREQADALSAALDDQAIAVVLDLVEPVGPVRNFFALVAMQGLNAFLSMTAR
jgi:hypothetical protein